jgi:uncharacterized protein (DUF2236 family)
MSMTKQRLAPDLFPSVPLSGDREGKAANSTARSVHSAQGALPFADDSPIRRIHGEGILLLGGGRALLMQIAEPRIAQGVAEHSSFRKDRLARLLRTLRPMFAIAFGSREQAMAAAAAVNRVHQTVAGDGYSARDRELLVWVLATLIDTTLLMHELLLAPLRAGEADAYYEQMQLVGELLGIARGAMPADLAEFGTFVTETTARLQVSSEAVALAEEIFRATAVTLPLMWPLKQLTAGLLPPCLRDGFGLPWGPVREGSLRLTFQATRALLPLLPPPLRRPPGLLMP